MKKLIIFSIVIALFGFIADGPVGAVPTPTAELELINGATTVTILDNSPQDLDPTQQGVVLFAGSVGDYTVNVTTGLTYPNLGTSASPELRLTTTDNSNGVPLAATDTLTILFTQTNFTAGQLHAVISASSTDDTGTATAQAWYDSTNMPFAKTTPIDGPLSITNTATSVSGTINTTSSTTGLYSITEQITLTPSGAPMEFGGTVDLHASSVVPEVSTLLLIGAGLLGLAGLRRGLKKT